MTADLAIQVVEAGCLGRHLGFGEVFVPALSATEKSLSEWRMEDDDAPILAYLYRNFRPKRHLEFGTWRGFGATLCATSCDAHVWTVNLPEGENLEGRPAYTSLAEGLPALAGADVFQHEGKAYVRTDSGPFIGHLYRDAGLAPRVTQILADSSELPLHKFDHDFFDTCLVDGGHEGHVVVADSLRALGWLRPGGLCLWHDFCPDPQVQATSPAAAGVTLTLLEHWPRLAALLDRAYWVYKSHLLIGVRKQHAPLADLLDDGRAPLGRAAARKASDALMKSAPDKQVYLKEQPLYTRHVIAAWRLGRHDAVVEVGGHLTPMASFFRDVPGEYYLVDPRCEPLEAEMLLGQKCKVRQLPIDLDSFDASKLAGKDYAVVFLGMQLDASAKSAAQYVDTIEKLLRLLAGSSRAVLEFPSAWGPSRVLMDIIVSLLRPTIDYEVTLDLSQIRDDDGDRHALPERLIRRLFVLSEFAPYAGDEASRSLIFSALYGAAGRALARIDQMAPLNGAFDPRHWTGEGGGQVTHRPDGVMVAGTAQRWAYAAALRLGEAARQQAVLALELEMHVREGVFYAAICNEDLSEIFVQKELRGPGLAKAVLEVTAPATQNTLLLRSGPDDARPRGRIVSLTVRGFGG
ncbi:MAG: class I SAM-dependent methyltransferase [Hyphomonadaceae bacterium]